METKNFKDHLDFSCPHRKKNPEKIPDEFNTIPLFSMTTDQGKVLTRNEGMYENLEPLSEKDFRGDSFVYITKGECHQSDPCLVRRKNGQLMVFFHAMPHAIGFGHEEGSGLHVSLSNDGGNMWSEKRFIEHNMGSASVIENTKEELVLALNLGLGLCTMTSNDGLIWSQPKHIYFSRANDSVGSLFQTENGYYLLYHSSRIEGDTPEYQSVIHRTSLTKSYDLEMWENPIALTEEGETTSALLKMRNGPFYLAYISRQKKGIVIKKSKDCLIWEDEHFFDIQIVFSYVMTLIEYLGRPVIFFVNHDILYKSTLFEGRWTEPIKLLDNIQLGASAAIIQDKVALVIIDEIKKRRDVCFTILDK